MGEVLDRVEVNVSGGESREQWRWGREAEVGEWLEGVKGRRSVNKEEMSVQDGGGTSTYTEEERQW